ncbi:MAG: hypothetical protein IPJ41_10570 [Phycisphaerales bacterium]|nr:hypothetical protein [Phycisphaerales bacterium]
MMNQPGKPDLHFDIDALFAHLATVLEHTPDMEREWHFTLRCDEFDRLVRVGESLEEEFDVHVQEEVETVEGDRTFMGPPLLAVMIQAALGPEEVKSLASKFASLAREEGLEYEGVMSFEPLDEEATFGWLGLEDAQWRLRHFTDGGLAPGCSMPFVFAIEAPAMERAEVVAEALAGFEEIEILEDEESPGIGVIGRAMGRNDEAVLVEMYERVGRLAAAAGAELVGVQFFDDEEDPDLDEDWDDGTEEEG